MAHAVLTLIEYAAERRDWEAVCRLVRVVEPILTLAGRWESCHRILSLGLRAANAVGDLSAEAFFNHELGTLQLIADEFDSAREHLERSLGLRERLGEGMDVTRHNLALMPLPVIPPPPPHPRRVRRFLGKAPIAVKGAVALFVLSVVGTGVVFIPGEGPSVDFTPRTVGFAAQQVSATGPSQSLTVMNTGSKPVRLRMQGLSGPGAPDFTVASNGCDAPPLPADSSCQILIAFSPTAASVRPADLTMTDVDSGKSWSASMQGVGTPGELKVNPSSLRFKGRTSAAQTVTITNTSGSARTIGALRVSGVNGRDFRVSRDSCADRVLAPDEICRFDVRFAPRAEGYRSAVAKLAMPGQSPDLVVPVSGTSEPVRDTVPPKISAQGDLTEEALDAAGAPVPIPLITAKDLVSGPAAVFCSSPERGPIKPGRLYLAVDETVVLTCQAKDAKGNRVTMSFTARVVDTTPPVLDLPADIPMYVFEGESAIVPYPTPTASDLVDGTVPVTCDHPSPDTYIFMSQTTVKCSATDAHRNTAEGSFNITILEQSPIE